MTEKPEKFIDENGIRSDKRRANEIRDVKIEVGVLSRADGSCYLEFGKNKVIAAVYGPRLGKGEGGGVVARFGS